MSIGILSSMFLLLTGIMATIVTGLFCLYLEGRARTVSIAVLVAWLLYAGILGYAGVIATRFPPGPALLVIPVILFMATFVARHQGVREFAGRVPVELLIGAQVFRVFVEIGLYGLYQHRLVPRLMTFEGGNLDIIFGLSAPLVAYLYASRRTNDAVVRVWCFVGIALLANIVVRSALTFSGAIKTEVPNTGIGMFPFTFIPGFLAPLALYLHVLLLRSLPRKATPLTTTNMG
ncbi:MAG: hypothetical protein H8F28_16545 [Fibrella sp.]|nr:hypothetical protein [Armatimonadota bacterium]